MNEEQIEHMHPVGDETGKQPWQEPKPTFVEPKLTKNTANLKTSHLLSSPGLPHSGYRVDWFSPDRPPPAIDTTASPAMLEYIWKRVITANRARQSAHSRRPRSSATTSPKSPQLSSRLRMPRARSAWLGSILV
jgi:hypothetical protein